MFDYTKRWMLHKMKAHAGTDLFIVLISSLEVFDVGRQVGIYNAKAGVVKHKPHSHASLISLYVHTNHVGIRCMN